MSHASFNHVVHLELHTSDPGGAQDLYGELLGWRGETIATRHGSYLALALGERLGGGIVECPAERTLWLPYVEVPDVHLATQRAHALGAAILLSPREGPSGWRSVIRTCAGGEVAFWQAKR